MNLYVQKEKVQIIKKLDNGLCRLCYNTMTIYLNDTMCHACKSHICIKCIDEIDTNVKLMIYSKISTQINPIPQQYSQRCVYPSKNIPHWILNMNKISCSPECFSYYRDNYREIYVDYVKNSVLKIIQYDVNHRYVGTEELNVDKINDIWGEMKDWKQKYKLIILKEYFINDIVGIIIDYH